MTQRAARRGLWWRGIATATVLLSACAALAVTYLFTDTFPFAYRLGDGQTSMDGKWYCAWTGYGEAGTELVNNDLALKLKPLGSTKPSETHSTLVYSTSSFTDGVIDVDVRTVEQLRLQKKGKSYIPAANSWEVAWVLWRVANASNFYYFMVKTNGAEFGRVVGGAQQILVTLTNPKLKVGVWDHWTIRVQGSRFTISVNSAIVADVTDLTPPAILSSGAVGLYCEDAYVQFDNVMVAAP